MLHLIAQLDEAKGQWQALRTLAPGAAAGHPPSSNPSFFSIVDFLPWLKQWHNIPDPNYGMGLGDYFQGFLEEQCRALEMTVQEVDAVRFEEAELSARKPASKQAKKRGRKGASAEGAGNGEVDEERINK